MVEENSQGQKGKDGLITIIIICVGLAFIGLAIAIYAVNNLNLRFGQESAVETPTPGITSTPSVEEQELSAPQDAVREFYSWWIDYEGNPLSDKAYLESEFLSAELKEKIPEARGYDPILCAQDIPPGFSIESVNLDGEEATVYLREEGFEQIIPIELKVIDGQWKIVDVVCSEAEDRRD